MNTRFAPSEILENVRSLIKQSCDSQGNINAFDSFHVALLKRYFGCSQIKYHRTDKSVEIEIMPVETSSHSAHIEIKPESLESFLISCIKEDDVSLGFYDKMLLYYATHIQGEQFHLQSA